MDKNLDTIKANIRAQIKRLRSDGTVGMSIANLRQITTTKGVTCAPPMYPRLFEQAAREVGDAMNFPVH